MSFLHQKSDKRWKLQGWNEPIGEEIARNERVIVIKTKGFSSNIGGTRGMPRMHYEPARIRVWTILKDDKTTLEVEELISYPAAARSKKRK